MKPDLYIVGAGGFGRELYTWLRSTSAWGRDWTFAGFLDDAPYALDGFDYDAEVVAPVSGFRCEAGQLFACGIGNLEMKRKACGPLIAAGAEFVTVVHDSAVVGANVQLGAGAVVCPGVLLTSDVEVGAMVLLNLGCTVGHDVKIGRWSTLSPQSNIGGGVQIGERVFLGAGAIIVPRLSVGDDCLVGAGAVVMRGVKSGQKVFGNPARPFDQGP